MHERIAFIGGGNMAAALIGGLLDSGHPPPQLRVAVKTPASAARLRQRFGIDTGCDAAVAVAGASIVVLAFKPHQLSVAMAGIVPAPHTLVISVLNGVRCAALQQACGATAQLVRAMPNTPALVRRGVSGAYADRCVPPAVRQRAAAVLGSVGSVHWVEDEPLLDAVTAVSGCGPAYFFRFVEALRSGGEALGLAPPLAAQLALETFTGAAALAAARTDDIATLRAQVTSKGGSTEAALAQLDAGGLDRLLGDALAAAQRVACARGEETAALDADAG